jgi:nicotinate-nucleotide adenylyltransferase
MSDLVKLKRIGLFGGTFDPIHIGHTIVTEWIYDSLELDKIFFIPNYIHPFQKRTNITPAQKRLQMLKLAVKDYPDFEISSIELDRKDVSYTVDTIRYFKKNYPGTELFYIIGADIIAEFFSWREPHEILRLANIVVFNRSTTNFREPFKNEKLIYIDSPFIEISSTHVRHRIKENRSFRSLLAPKVYEFIIENKLYSPELPEKVKPVIGNQ